MNIESVFPRDRYKKLIESIFPPGSTVFWKGEPVPYFAPVAEYQTPIVVQLDEGTAKGYGTNETRRCWVPEAQNGLGAYAYYNLQRMQWPLTIDVETFSSEHPGEDFLMNARNRLRWRSSIKTIQDMGLTTAHVGIVISQIRQTGSMTEDGHETFGAVLQVSHGQVYALLEEDDDGSVIETITSIPGTILGGIPSPLDIDLGPFPPNTTADDGDDNLIYVDPVNTPQSIGAGTRTLFNTYGLSATLALLAPLASIDGTLFVTGDAGEMVETDEATLTDTNGFQLENPIDGMFYDMLTWGPGSGGDGPNPTLPAGGVYKWVRTTVALFAGNVTRWKISM